MDVSEPENLKLINTNMEKLNNEVPKVLFDSIRNVVKCPHCGTEQSYFQGLPLPIQLICGPTSGCGGVMEIVGAMAITGQQLTGAELIAQDDAEAVRRSLPPHYVLTSGTKDRCHWIRCKSSVGIRKPPYKKRVRIQPNPPYLRYEYQNIIVNDDEDNEHWLYIFEAIKQHFGKRFLEVYHNTCFCHVDFVVYFRPSPQNLQP